MSQTTSQTESTFLKAKLDLSIPTIERMLPSFELGDFALLHGTSAVSYLVSLLCVKAQLPNQFGGLASKAIFVDGGNTFRLYQISKMAQSQGLVPVQVLKQISVARAFTAYQMISLMTDKLSEQLQRKDAKLAIISDIAGLFLDEDIADEEAQIIYEYSVRSLHSIAKQEQVILVATCLPHGYTKRAVALQASTNANADVVASIRNSEHHRYFTLEKHPKYALGSVEFPSAHPTLPEFCGGLD